VCGNLLLSSVCGNVHLHITEDIVSARQAKVSVHIDIILIVAGIFSHLPSYCEVGCVCGGGGGGWSQNVSLPAFDRTILWAVYSSDSKTCCPFSCSRPIVTRPAGHPL